MSKIGKTNSSVNKAMVTHDKPSEVSGKKMFADKKIKQMHQDSTKVKKQMQAAQSQQHSQSKSITDRKTQSS